MAAMIPPTIGVVAFLTSGVIDELDTLLAIQDVSMLRR
jgi:hypothetical protein